MYISNLLLLLLILLLLLLLRYYYSIGLCRNNFLLYRAVVGMLARGSRMGYQAGMTAPTDEHVV
jgi:hypothetical protein